ncbi:hypothetical protein CEXT_115621 [Caerostris extrusa]|uniref:Uncharacterized protein n=1 Tax=Caerostris extrusa TaxID=172846 RepID=A0AAV4S1V3_CAEEX|nr:hypothetical protein CEXT_115621 [Caerostris extrusa]
MLSQQITEQKMKIRNKTYKRQLKRTSTISEKNRRIQEARSVSKQSSLVLRAKESDRNCSHWDQHLKNFGLPEPAQVVWPTDGADDWLFENESWSSVINASWIPWGKGEGNKKMVDKNLSK